MNRRAKFRVWDKILKYYRNPSEFAVGGNGVLLETKTGFYESFQNVNYLDAISDYVVQWETGLKDKNGCEIYEGDIVQWIVVPRWMRYDFEFEEWEKQGKVMQKVIKAVKWEHNAFHCFTSSPYPPYNNETCEVVGNIFDNPELLKQ